MNAMIIDTTLDEVRASITVQGTMSQTLFNLESIQRFRAARSAEQAAQLTHQDSLDMVTLAIGNAYLQVIEANSRIEAQEAQVRNAEICLRPRTPKLLLRR